MAIDIETLRRYALARSLFPPTTLKRAIHRLGFVQADPIRAPARAQDLTLRHRVKDYRAGDLEQRYARLPIEEDFFINYGFLPRGTQALMHPRTARQVWTPDRWAQAQEVLAWVSGQGRVHPARGGCTFCPRQGHELVWRLVERDHATARWHALLPRPVARGGA